MNDHLAEPLDYLYEELSPERMAEARKHLASCPDCRARVRAIRETVKQYRDLPRPAAPEGLAARAAADGIAAANKLPHRRVPAADMAAALDKMSAANAVPHAPPPPPVVLEVPAPEPPERRQARLEEDFDRLKKEVKDEMRRGWRQWFFHPAWTIAASALLIGSLAIHFSPRDRATPAPTLYLRENVPPEGAARDLRDRERLPAPQPHIVAEVPAAEPPAVLQQARARQDLRLPPMERMRLPEPPPPPPEPKETTPLLAPEELAALVAVSADADDTTTVVTMTEMMTDREPPRLIERPAGFDRAERVRTLTALAGMQIASGEIADAWKTVDMLRSYDEAAAEEIRRILAKAERVALAEKAKKPALLPPPPPPAPEPEPIPAPTPEQTPDPTPEPTPEPEPVLEAKSEPAPEPEPEPEQKPVVPAAPAVPPAPAAPPVAPVQVRVYIQPTPPPPAPVPVPAPRPEQPFIPEPAPAPAPAPEPEPVLEPAPEPERERFTTDPYLRDD